jgi:hypothetical protein
VGGAEKPRTGPGGTLGSRNESKGGLNSEGPCELSFRELVFTIAETGIGHDAKDGFEHNGKGKYLTTVGWPGKFKDIPTPGLQKGIWGRPDTTKERIALIAQDGPYFELPQFLTGLFSASDFLTVLRDYPEAQQFIDGLYKVYYCFSESRFHLPPFPDF